MTYLKMEYQGTYYYANLIQYILENRFDYLMNLEGFFCDSEVIYHTRPFLKCSILHNFISFIIEAHLSEEAVNLNARDCRDYSNFDFDNPTYITPLEYVLKTYEIPHISFMEWWKENYPEESIKNEELFTYYFEEYSGTSEWETVIEALTEDVFHILFLNRDLLQKFNNMLSGYLEMCIGSDDATVIIENEDLQKYIRPNLKLYRKNIPNWVKKAVYYRDRGRCVYCNKDLTGLVSIFNKENYDHIVPLNEYGFNDVTNIQLLCRKCNEDKSGKQKNPAKNYERWY
ncbi:MULTISPECIES: HNH endonuclease [Bacillus]|uniref:HNH endonuclease n=1 Tax=Bacillus TaxID=1386 RepID=UPI001BA70A3C|nr:hypothetical protein [Bacillus cereus]